MTLIEFYQTQMLEALEGRNVLVMGENIDNGSRISGLSKGLEKLTTGKVLNIGNCELTHAGIGMGMMLDGGNVVLVVKQLDFLLLALDQLVNTYNWIQASSALRTKPLGSFTIVTYICDQGYQGPQSSMVDMCGYHSFGGFPAFILQEETQARQVLGRNLVAPGFRMIGIPQKDAGKPIPSHLVTRQDPSAGWYQYGEGVGTCILSCHSSFPQADLLKEALEKAGQPAFILLLDLVPGIDPAAAIECPDRIRNAVVLDDSKGLVKFGDLAARKFAAGHPGIPITFLERSYPIDQRINPDGTGWDIDAAARSLARPADIN